MTKRMSTFLTMGLLIAGSWFGSASAQTEAVALDLTTIELDADALDNYYYIGLSDESYYLKTKAVENTATEKTFYSLEGVASADLSDADNAALFKISLTTWGTTRVFTLTDRDGHTVVFNPTTGTSATSTTLISSGDSEDAVAAYYSTISAVEFKTTPDAKLVPIYDGAGTNTNQIQCDGGGTVSIVAADNGTAFALFSVDDIAVEADDLNSVLGNGFSLDFMKDETFENELSIEDNPFAETITAVAGDENELFFRVSGSWDGFDDWSDMTSAEIEAFRASEFIVVDTINWKNSTSTGIDSWKYIVVKGSTMMNEDGETYAAYNGTANNTEDEDITRNIINAIFKVESNVNRDYYMISSPKAVADLDPTYVSGNHPLSWHTTTVDPNYLTVLNFNGEYYIGSGDATDTYPVLSAGNALEQGELVGIVNITSLDWSDGTYGKIFGPETTDATSAVDTSLVNLNQPEGQWLVTCDASDNYTFTNRESGIAWSAGAMRVVDAEEYIFASAAGDTVEITAAKATDEFAGWKKFTDAELTDTNYRLAIRSAVTNNVYLAEKHNSDDHYVGLTTDVDAAGEWILVAQEDTLKNVTNALSYLKENAYAEIKDTLYVITYKIRNASNGEYLKYDADADAYYCDPEGGADLFAFKMKNDSTYNLVKVDNAETIADNVETYAAKSYGAFSVNKVVATAGVYDVAENDLFFVEKVAAPEYRKLTMGDTIKVYKQGNEKIALYEQGKFLGMQHVADVDDMKAAMYVDTAYVRAATTMPQYMLVKDVTRIVDNDNCNNKNHAKHVSDTTYGRFLVNMADSAYAYGISKHDNPYVWENTSSFKLAFVDGYHTEDTLFITNAEGKVASKVAVGNNNKVGIAKYAFKYVDREEGSFVIETGTKTSATAAAKGYIKWLNGVPAVVTNEDQAEVFNLKATSEVPTANEEITAEGVKVIAGEGFVTVKSAAGKKVVIANVLGQTVANTIASSDEAQIAAPAGVVIVAVEGEAAVKAIVK